MRIAVDVECRLDDAAAVARRDLDLFKDSEHVVVPSGSCAWMVKHEYPGLLAGTPLAREAGELGDGVERWLASGDWVLARCDRLLVSPDD